MSKKELRAYWAAQRDQLSSDRIKKASKTLSEVILGRFPPDSLILTFSSFRGELPTVELNQKLAEQHSLVLPKVVNDELWLYKVTCLKTQLHENQWKILEPIIEKCERVDPEEIDVALVPALSFDSQHHRLGYGKGHYDRFLAKHCKARENSIGVAFKEQHSTTLLPSEPHDVALSEVLYF